MINNELNINRLEKFLILLFFASRLFIWIFRPQAFTEIIYSYMPYAHQWADGYTPYLKIWYEYPPATIPLFFIPHLLDIAFPGVTYLVFYRGILLLIDVGLFFLIWRALKKMSVNNSVFIGGIIYYCLVTAKAHHFIFDTMDITFATSMTISALAPLFYLLNEKTNIRSYKFQIIGWLGFWIATALKLVNAPLLPLYLWIDRFNWKRAIVTSTIAFAMVWGIPLIYFRSSLQVILVYHKIRGIQIESAPAVIASTINRFTQSEEIVELYKNYEIVGPISSSIKQFFDIFFPAMIFFVIAYGLWIITKCKSKYYYQVYIYITLLYIFGFMISGKVLSTPFLLWHMPLLAVFPFKSIKEQLAFTLPSLIIVIGSMSPIPNLPIGIFSIHLIIGWMRIGLFAYLFFRLLHLGQKRFLGNQDE